jgi:Fic family protein
VTVYTVTLDLNRHTQQRHDVVGYFVDRRWEGDPSAYGSRKARASFTYRAFVPDPVARIDPGFRFETHALLLDAAAAVTALNAADASIGLEAIGPLLLRSEAVGSSAIEGHAVSQRNLARALVQPDAARGAARIVAANVLAMEEAISLGEADRPLTADDVLAIHRRLMAHDPKAGPGAFRTEQNWVGGRVLTSPYDARYIPPPESEVIPLVEDLIAFLNRDDLPPVAQAAIAHAQFETIHPFIDGNGRVGRCLIHVVFRRRGISTRFVPPVSVVLAASPDAYVAGLEGYRSTGIEAWCAAFAEATERAAILGTRISEEIAALVAEWFERAGRPRRDSSTAKIIPLLPAQPITSAVTIRAAIGTRHQRALEGLRALESAGVIKKVSGRDWDQQFAAEEIFDLVERYEAQVKTPAAQTVGR